jgi:hypothetical protein
MAISSLQGLSNASDVSAVETNNSATEVRINGWSGFNSEASKGIPASLNTQRASSAAAATNLFKNGNI